MINYSKILDKPLLYDIPIQSLIIEGECYLKYAIPIEMIKLSKKI